MPRRTTTVGQHTLLPAADSSNEIIVPLVPTRSFFAWTFGRGTAIWRIWPAVLLHTAFAALVVTLSLRGLIRLSIPNVLLTLLGVVIGFVISYRAMSGYDRYWQGRSMWTDVIRQSRTFARFIWYHVPLKIENEQNNGQEQTKEDKAKAKTEKLKVVQRVMAEKRMALDLIEAFSVAVKHHLRGEKGIYYQDLYPLVKPLHDHSNHHRQPTKPLGPSEREPTVTIRQPAHISDPVIPPINGYGATKMSRPGNHSHTSHFSVSSHSSDADEHSPLLPGMLAAAKQGLVGNVSSDLIPFAGLVSDLAACFRRDARTAPPAGDVEAAEQMREADALGGMSERHYWTHAKHRPRIAGGGQNVPLQIVRCLSTWLSVCEERGCVPGTTLGNMFGCLSAFEDSLANMEKILTTPLPFMFSVHINTVWLYLFALPFQLVDLFQWYTIPGVCIASFIYLGFVASGEEIEQPFGYDENDLDLDLFCREVIHADIVHLKRTPTRNVFLGAHHAGDEVVVDASEEDEDRLGRRGRIEEVFGVVKNVGED
ncbi:Bestrophin, RFP-TM, chloride channel-domain-containing protein [Phanerochaete sordida]|uniref:Bestrophin, RFP-TM, chloride channel-domain-containing protein n=1 Tax=Phanerochaete sordida TaxID=48140 RepID=A0A9P3GLA4_9APHY|nr:Bestrophin, RFP-TM, chloride channel-domain-containing protein [Phanerochaete sordida]